MRRLFNWKNVCSIIFLTVVFSTLFAISSYEWMYDFEIIRNSIFLNFIMVLLMIVSALYLGVHLGAISVSMALGLFVFLSVTNGHDLLNRHRIQISEEHHLPDEDGAIVPWGGGGFFQSAYFYYLMRTPFTDDGSIMEQIEQGDAYAFLSNEDCSADLRRVDADHIVIGSPCG